MPKHFVKKALWVPSTLDTPRNRESIPQADFSKWVSLDAVADTIHFLWSERAVKSGKV
ncbi:MAG: hypothetical protein HC880_10395 [Bacteroidia bacterium]|nr:hypothetical protein [Bacteroidia bacterium]